MTGDMRLIDTNVLVHAYTLSDERNLCELFSVITRKVAKPVSASSAAAIVEGILVASQWTVIDRMPQTVLKAMEMVRLYRAPFWDALIAACMLENGIEIIVTENERDFRRIPGITVTNPFRTTLRK